MDNQIIIKWTDDGETSISYQGNVSKDELYSILKELYAIPKNSADKKINKYKVCESCGSAFAPISKETEVYCPACRHVGYTNKIKRDEFLSAYLTAYKTKHAQKQRKTIGKGGSIEIRKKYQDAIKKWRDEAKIKLEQVRNNQISKEEFYEYLNCKLEV